MTRQCVVESGMSPESALAAVAEVVRQRKGRIEVSAPQHFEARTGSQIAMRAKGAMLCKPSEVPLVIAARFDAVPGGSRVAVSVQDDMGFGLRAGTTKKFTLAVDETIELIAQSLRINVPPTDSRPRGGLPAACPNGHSVSADAAFCGTCGTALHTS